jgi:hypothetical protein
VRYTIVDRQEAPARSPERAKRRVEGMEALVASLEPGKVARIELGEDENPRRVSEQLYKTANRSGKLVETWEVGGILYAEVAGTAGS